MENENRKIIQHLDVVDGQHYRDSRRRRGQCLHDGARQLNDIGDPWLRPLCEGAQRDCPRRRGADGPPALATPGNGCRQRFTGDPTLPDPRWTANDYAGGVRGRQSSFDGSQLLQAAD
ncbi:hypothetical protein MPRG_46250 [Mycobacterium paragordonae]|uniref:Uncharacterized protein n=1 Tax=Mycobacterium paragordonae TaxID=1389713 RepID=A0ABQ1CAC4_9MYCO|nr:hypothetical protein MPRG_46250 [Mycobacterium paragordonae]